MSCERERESAVGTVTGCHVRARAVVTVTVRMSCERERECCGTVGLSDNSMSCESKHCGTVSVTVSGCHVGESVVAM